MPNSMNICMSQMKLGTAEAPSFIWHTWRFNLFRLFPCRVINHGMGKLGTKHRNCQKNKNSPYANLNSQKYRIGTLTTTVPSHQRPNLCDSPPMASPRYWRGFVALDIQPHSHRFLILEEVMEDESGEKFGDKDADQVLKKIGTELCPSERQCEEVILLYLNNKKILASGDTSIFETLHTYSPPVVYIQTRLTDSEKIKRDAGISSHDLNIWHVAKVKKALGPLSSLFRKKNSGAATRGLGSAAAADGDGGAAAMDASTDTGAAYLHMGGLAEAMGAMG